MLRENMRYEFKRKPKTCPKCGASTIAEILYGYPLFSEIQDDLDAGKIVLGGCCISPYSPKWQCTTCNTELFTPNKLLEEYNKMKTKNLN